MGNVAGAGAEPDEGMKRAVLGLECTARRVLENLRDGKYASVVVMAGAGISVSCGIPDFRTPGTGLYDNLQRFNLPTPESVFELDFFRASKGEAFYKLAKEMWPDNFKPSPTHLFVRLLHDKGLLRRAFTQNIDTLERVAGVPDDKLVEAHGSFANSSCTRCRKPFDAERSKNAILEGKTPIMCEEPGCGGLVKPDIVFFGEGLPAKFGICSSSDLPQADLLIVMGTSLTVHPFAGLVEMVPPDCPRLLLNMKPVGVRIPSEESNGLRLNQPENWRDAMIQGPCDEAVRAICDILGWREDLEALVESFGSNGGPSLDPIDPLVAFPAMAPDGLDKNWRLDEDVTKRLPSPPRPPRFHSEDFDLPLLESAARAEEGGGMELFIFEEYTTLRPSGQIAGMLCLTGESLENWNGCHVLALVEAGMERWDMEVISNCELLDEPMTKPGPEDKRAAFHQAAFQIPPGGTMEFELWYVDTTNGRVSARWGPFQLRKTKKNSTTGASAAGGANHLVGVDTSSEDGDDSAEESLDLDRAVDEIVSAMNELPSHLVDADPNDVKDKTEKAKDDGQGTK
ncbi:NAD-dependent protein deacetylase hst2 [Hondaea fermentalgiana]|uniref:NAD-dependent protein deacetylase hst2 n=1 Tax=Hondaea fermentalgiana TaxID=2315210 RepID=A0A2R5G9H0_9STRA|nr:NAD-dependent protein deacetylase hst2 [Hondaea fermentalgiana]|eukprot:GBG27195.1 NAD-dependent protein deacetylase hst2 [Hondaea fermentalgiana]